MSNIAIIGEREIVIGFSLIGILIFPVTDSTEAKGALEKCSTNGSCQIIFITDSVAK